MSSRWLCLLGFAASPSGSEFSDCNARRGFVRICQHPTGDAMAPYGCHGTMENPPAGEFTQLLLAWRDGDPGALATLTPMVYDVLHRLARHYMSREHQGHTLQATALVNEAYLKLVDSSRVQWQSRAHFVAIAAQLMRRILVDFARHRLYQKRGGDWRQVTLDEAIAISLEPGSDLVALDEALTSLAALDARKAKVVEMRFFGGLTLQETAEVLNVSIDTIGRDWSAAKAWLLRELTQT
jgi:RNA polymerase sigma-70 factor, ECF subfamily